METLAGSHSYKYTWYMSQVTIYLPEDVARRVRREARKRGLSLSAYMADIARRAAGSEGRQKELRALYGSCAIGAIDELALGEVEPM